MTTLSKPISCILIAILLWSCAGYTGAPEQGWYVFSIFIAVIFSFILQPFPMGATVLFGLVILSISGNVTIKEAMHGYGNTTVWLVVAAFLIAGAIIASNLGKRIALKMISLLGKSPLGLAYGICSSELILAPVIPSNTARGGGILAPIVDSIAKTLQTDDSEKPSNIASFLIVVAAQINLVTSAMFLTAMAANPLISFAAKDAFSINFDWNTWALGAIVPGMMSLILLPLFIYKLLPPEQTHTTAAQNVAKQSLEKMGEMTKREWIIAVTLPLLMLLWMTKAWHGMGTTLVAWLGVCVLIVSQALSWDEVIKNEKAWDVLLWLGGLLTMATMLKDYGFIEWLTNIISIHVGVFEGVTLVVAIAIIYFYSMYAFSMFTAHISALVMTLFLLLAANSAPPMLAVALIAYFSTLCGCITNYSTGPIVIYFGLGYVSVKKWFYIGFLISLFHLFIWLSVGMMWWKYLGYY